MKRRLSRPRSRSRRRRSPFAVRLTGCCRTVLSAVLAVLYLISTRATRVAAILPPRPSAGRLLAELMADEPEVYGLLALMLIHDSRGGARGGGELIRWRADRFAHDRAEVEAGRSRSIGDWRCAVGWAVSAPRRRSHRFRPRRTSTGTRSRCSTNASKSSPARRSLPQRAVALAEAGAPERALELVDSLELVEYRYLQSTRAEAAAVSAATTKPGRRSSAPCGWPRPSRSVGSSSAGCRSCEGGPTGPGGPARTRPGERPLLKAGISR